MTKPTNKPRNNNAKRAQTLGADAIQRQCRKASHNSPWRRQAACSSEKARESRARLDELDKGCEPTPGPQ